MPEITSNVVPCCVTDISTGRILWEERVANATLSNGHDSEPLWNLPDLSWVDCVVHSAQEGLS